MIQKLILKNFKRIKEQSFEFNKFDLIVGANNSGKSTLLQALAIWQYCVDQFKQVKKQGGRGIQIVLPNFTALPVPEFNLLWTDRFATTGKSYIYIEIDVHWQNAKGQELQFAISLRYQSPQSVYAIPKEGWDNFAELEADSSFPRIVYVPPFSGLEPHEKWMDDGNVRQNIGKAQPGSVLRNLLFRVLDKEGLAPNENKNWLEIKKKIEEWFGLQLLTPKYEKGVSTEIIVEFKSNKKTFDVISGGSGFHQIITLMAFLYGYPDVTTILFDEPDAHLHVNLQRKIINYFKENSNKQFLIASHSEEFIKGVEISSVLSLLSGTPRRVQSNNEILTALSDVDNIDVVRTQNSPYILYLEGEDDERLLAVWASKLQMEDVYQKFYPYILSGSSKSAMKARSDKHFMALKQIVPSVKRAILLDYDSEELAINPPKDQLVLNEWKRKNIDNYLLVTSAWNRAAIQNMGFSLQAPPLEAKPYLTIIDDFFKGQNLTLPPRSKWNNLNAEIFKIVDGKKLLFERSDSLFNKLNNVQPRPMQLNRTTVAEAMEVDEIHDDIRNFFRNLEKIVSS